MIGALITLLVVIVLIAVFYFLGYISFGKLEEGDYCVPEEFKANATEYKIDDESNCVVSNCATGFTLTGGVCVAVTPATVENAECTPDTYVEGGLNYKEIKNSDGTFTCKPTACSNLYTYDSTTNDCTQTGVEPTVVQPGQDCVPDAYVTYGNSYKYGADATTCELKGCSNSYLPIEGQCAEECVVGSGAVTDAKYYRLAGTEDIADNCKALACNQTSANKYPTFSPTETSTEFGGAKIVTACNSTASYTPRRSGYSLRYNSKKLEGVKL